MPRQEAPMSFRKFAAKAAEIVGSSRICADDSDKTA